MRKRRKGSATKLRLQWRRTVLWEAMGFFSARQGWMAALLASFLALFVLVSAVEAATCAPEMVTAHASESVREAPADPVNDLDSHVICSHGHCHHGGTAMPSSPQSVAVTAAVAPSLLRPADEPMASRAPSGLERPPRA